ncbi:hypothetical protein OV079_52370 [Nannocystis pusilla]|uniref:Uncharacterized protein n=1 Tax=Nannocystis pusilla TaxID=889268 RepID=A0A9X3F2C5_9BACT|nr:hypothetical protein [Nannocystis pusilla]MCY1013985.1 hypothetical protein [Nannocystis pusilla]
MPDPTWPAEVPEFAAAWTEFYRQLDRVAWRLMRVFATALALPREFFDDKVDRNISCLRALDTRTSRPRRSPASSAPAPTPTTAASRCSA